MALADLIKQKITEEGPLSFRDFMEMALYYPELGYYTSPGNKIGRAGDFYTISTLTPLFGQMLAKQFEEMWRLLGRKPFTIVEYGAGTGSLCRAVLDELKNYPDLYSELHYCIIEKSPVMREVEQRALQEKVTWYCKIEDIPFDISCVFSNEVADNFSVHRILMQDELMEVFVDYGDEFTDVLQPASDSLKSYLSELEIDLPRDYCTEINLQATEWIRDIARVLKKGFVLTIDYGFPAAELYCHQRRKGTMVCYSRHHVNDLPYQNIGGQDITTHINFSALRRWGEKNGLACCGFTNQAYFLYSLGFAQHLREKEMKGEVQHRDAAEMVFLLHRMLTDMGSKFKVLVQQKGIECHLSGLQLSQRIN